LELGLAATRELLLCCLLGICVLLVSLGLDNGELLVLILVAASTECVLRESAAVNLLQSVAAVCGCYNRQLQLWALCPDKALSYLLDLQRQIIEIKST
jgi:hypothetical protein